jgi:hypothetical protein
MAGKIIADTIETGAGADISTSYVVNGSAKAWAKYDNSATLADSFNIASTVDVGTGQWRFAKTTSMSSTNYAVVGINGYQIGIFEATTHNTNAIESSANHTHSMYDPTSSVFRDFYTSGGYGMHNVHGDLA